MSSKSIDETVLQEKLFETKAKRSIAEKPAALHRNAAWVDEDDEEVVVDLETSRLKKLRKTQEETHVSGGVFQERLKKQFKSGRSAAAWADLDAIDAKKTNHNEDSEEEEDIFAGSTNLLGTGQGDVLPPITLDVLRMKDANIQSPSNSVVQSTQFHANGQLLLTAGLDKTLRLFQIDGKQNPKIESIYLKDLPISCAKFSNDGKRAIMTGARPYFYVYDIEGGNVNRIPRVGARKEKRWLSFESSNDHLAMLGDDGVISLLSERSNEWIGSLKMNGSVRSVAFCPDERYLMSTGSDGEIYQWDLRMKKCVYRVADEGSLGSGAIATSNDGKYLAVGADSGVVNIYDPSTIRHGVAPKPTKSMMQLTTAVTSLKFNGDSQILSMVTKETKDTLKMVHLPSCTVFANWPTSKTPLNYVSCVDFSPSSGYFAIGNARGRVLLYRLTHYAST
ncbi:U3 small nucleolar RNA-associated protein 18 [Thraustotheca clavata]|uniref:U3 small nucleolar RNA-associated protein 18 homolog n=1 Tax=Thraustotheca clavata TaxID=74557 RepID=A0A1V9Z5N2_9STRA|nr:U3 small nucleolar RNA-associated protein 18 [Thraustotheca clavata]